MARVLSFNRGDAAPDDLEGEAVGPSPEELAAAKEYEVLNGLTLEEVYQLGHKALVARLVSRCRAGIASHQELAILRNLLKDNGLTLGITPDKPASGEKLPLPDDVEVPEYGPPEQ
ncbi:MAG: hypothetical protein EOR11_19900 [Mesorhizobium sp.]|uniref:hypothetical protein n=1 Tax=Mesorhizobium sp. TaxID=1871066 RepID=UPI000FE92678|nr:hypothetical protein [Mesorhizobium sp.]RWP84726.1 MAG: hypothetical protein EOR11_19900 [Mesorhizobium sp.]